MPALWPPLPHMICVVTSCCVDQWITYKLTLTPCSDDGLVWLLLPFPLRDKPLGTATWMPCGHSPRQSLHHLSYPESAIPGVCVMLFPLPPFSRTVILIRTSDLRRVCTHVDSMVAKGRSDLKDIHCCIMLTHPGFFCVYSCIHWCITPRIELHLVDGS